MADPFVSGVLLAAGRSRRFGAGRPKQLVEVEGEPMVRRAARIALASRLDELVVVLGHAAAEVEAALAGLASRSTLNADFAAGQSTSIRRGLAGLDRRATAAVFLPCDQPLLTSSVIDALVEAHLAGGAPIVVPVFEGRRGAPTLFARRFFAELEALRGDVGGRKLLERHASAVSTVELASERPLLDVDTTADLRRLGLVPTMPMLRGD